MSGTTILLAENQELLSDGLVALLSRQSGLRMVGKVSDGERAVELVRTLHPDVLLLDVALPGGPATRVVRRTLRHAPLTRILVLAGHPDLVLRGELERAGAECVVSKLDSGNDLIKAVLRASTSPRPPVGKGAPLLSDREQQVLALLAKSLSNRAIAKELSIAEGTVKRHTSNIYAKLEARSRIHAVQRAQLLGVVGDD